MNVQVIFVSKKCVDRSFYSILCFLIFVCAASSVMAETYTQKTNMGTNKNWIGNIGYFKTSGGTSATTSNITTANTFIIPSGMTARTGSGTETFNSNLTVETGSTLAIKNNANATVTIYNLIFQGGKIADWTAVKIRLPVQFG